MRNWIRDLTDFIFISDEPAPADVIFIPGNAHAEPSERAAALYREGLAPFLLPSGRYAAAAAGFAGQASGARRYDGLYESEWAFMRAVLLQNGVPDEAILREDRARFTYQNAIASRACTQEAGLTIRRALLCCPRQTLLYVLQRAVPGSRHPCLSRRRLPADPGQLDEQQAGNRCRTG